MVIIFFIRTPQIHSSRFWIKNQIFKLHLTAEKWKPYFTSIMVSGNKINQNIHYLSTQVNLILFLIFMHYEESAPYIDIFTMQYSVLFPAFIANKHRRRQFYYYFFLLLFIFYLFFLCVCVNKWQILPVSFQRSSLVGFCLFLIYSQHIDKIADS